MTNFYNFLKIIIGIFAILIVIVIIFLSPFLYKKAEKYHETHICEAKTDCYKTEFSPQCANEKWEQFAKNFQSGKKNFDDCECKNLVVANYCGEK